MRVGFAGSHGLIGSAAVTHLEAQGHEVVRLVRWSAGPAEVQWDPVGGVTRPDLLEGLDALVNAAGSPMVGRWTRRRVAAVRTSRVAGTETLATAAANLETPPAVFVTICSANGFYGERGDEILTEESAPGSGIFTALSQAWEAASIAASRAGIRVVQLRTGWVLSTEGGDLKSLLLPAKLGLRASMGNGRQWLSWIAAYDHAAAIEFVLTHDQLAGPVNATAPNPVRSKDFGDTLAAVLDRPARLRIPREALRGAFGRTFADRVALPSRRVLPARLLQAGFEFQSPTLDHALRCLLHCESSSADGGPVKPE